MVIKINRKFIWVHIPKTAGTSLRNSVESIGKENVFLDYNRPMKDRTFLRNCKNIVSSFSTKKISQKIIYGHIMPCKYCDFRLDGFHKRKDHVYLTFLRDPLQKAISEYYYIQRNPLPQIAVPLRKKIVKEKWSIETCLTYKGFYQNSYSKFFFWFSS